MSTSSAFAQLVWCQVRDEEGQLFYITGSNDGINTKLLQPEGQDIYFSEYRPYKKSIQLKAKNPEKIGEFTHWEYDRTSWRSITEDEWIYSPAERMGQLKTLYPDYACKIMGDTKGKVLAFMTDPLDVSVEIAVIFKHLGSKSCEQTELFRAKADSIVMRGGGAVSYYWPDSGFCAKKINLDEMKLECALPDHPSIASWCDLAFNKEGNLLFARHKVSKSLLSQYWIIKDGDWKLLHEGPYPEQTLRLEENHVYLFAYADKGLTIKWLNAKYEFEPTNVNNFPIQLIFGDFKASTVNPTELLALKDYSEAKYSWCFLNPESSILKTEYDNLLNELRKKWEFEGKHYKDRALSIHDIEINEYGHLNKLFFRFPENPSLDGFFTVNSNTTPMNEDKFHNPLQMQKVDVDGLPVPYFYVAPEGEPNGKSIVMMEGGPQGEYHGGYSFRIKAFTQVGWSVIVPQESLRTGFGWQHFCKGFGEAGRKNLHQLLHVFHDAIDKHLIENPEQVYLYGHSYGGFVASSLALVWDELHNQAKLTKLFNFREIIADGAFVEIDPVQGAFELIIGETDIKTFNETFMPLHLVGKSLSAPLTLVHGKVDIRCSANATRAFTSKLKAAQLPFNMFWHKGGHGVGHELYPGFLLALMEGKTIDKVATEIGLVQEL